MRNTTSTRNVDALRAELRYEKNEKSELRRENEVLRQQNMMLLETLSAITEEESYWSEDARKTGIVFRLKNVLTQIKDNF